MLFCCVFVFLFMFCVCVFVLLLEYAMLPQIPVVGHSTHLYKSFVKLDRPACCLWMGCDDINILISGGRMLNEKIEDSYLWQRYNHTYLHSQNKWMLHSTFNHVLYTLFSLLGFFFPVLYCISFFFVCENCQHSQSKHQLSVVRPKKNGFVLCVVSYCHLFFCARSQ